MDKETKHRQGNKRQARTKGTTWSIKQQGLTRDTWEGAEPETGEGPDKRAETGGAKDQNKQKHMEQSDRQHMDMTRQKQEAR